MPTTTNYIEKACGTDIPMSVKEPAVAYRYGQETCSTDSASLTESFYSHYTKWQTDTLFLSSTSAILQHPDLMAIAQMGDAVVPLVLSEIRTVPSFLYKVLEKIYGKSLLPVKTEQHGSVVMGYEDVEKNCKLWIEQLS